MSSQEEIEGHASSSGFATFQKFKTLRTKRTHVRRPFHNSLGFKPRFSACACQNSQVPVSSRLHFADILLLGSLVSRSSSKKRGPMSKRPVQGVVTRPKTGWTTRARQKIGWFCPLSRICLGDIPISVTMNRLS